MDILQILLRLLHIGLGVFWVGAILFNVFFLVPSIRDAGPEGARVAAALAKRRFMDITPLIALVTIISGVWLYWRISGGFQPAYVHSPMGMTLAVGGLCAIVAFVIGVSVMRPAMLEAGRLGQAAGQMSEAERPALMAKVQALRTRAAGAGRWVAVFLILSVVAMAVARYA